MVQEVDGNCAAVSKSSLHLFSVFFCFFFVWVYLAMKTSLPTASLDSIYIHVANEAEWRNAIAHQISRANFSTILYI